MALPSSGEAGSLVCALEVVDGDEVMMVTSGGKVIRLPVEEVPCQGRRTKGSRVVQLSAGDRVVEVTRAQSGERNSPQLPAPPEQDDDIESDSGDTIPQLELLDRGEL